MNIKKTTVATLISGVLLLGLPISSTVAHENHCEIKETELGQLMKHMKSELRGYVKGFKSEDQAKMQAHLNELLTLAEKAHQFIPVTISNLKEMDHPKMAGKRWKAWFIAI
ncbi:hypothetical protein [Psychromonas sp. KJ10-2]|uniref:hypothetical protein n=1 Tax=Psychromonas sp. KJ10-2 TaxID=3391822 RepID=UPI0039B507EE